MIQKKPKIYRWKPVLSGEQLDAYLDAVIEREGQILTRDIRTSRKEEIYA